MSDVGWAEDPPWASPVSPNKDKHAKPRVTSAHARQLVEVARSLRANVNLIRYNEVKGMPFERPDDADVLAFQNVLRDKGVNTHIRASRGRNIAAACGQLRHEGKSQSAVGSGQ